LDQGTRHAHASFPELVAQTYIKYYRMFQYINKI